MAKRQAKAVNDKSKNGNGATLGFEEKLWLSADKLRGSIDAAEYKHVVLGLLFLKYISDAFQARREELQALCDDPESDYFTGGDAAWAEQTLEDRDEYASKNVFWVPPGARWPDLRAKAKRPDIAKIIDDAMFEVEKANPRLKNVLPRDYARRGIPAERLGELIDLISGIGLGDKESRAQDILGRVYEYFLGKFAAAEGKLGGEFYTPRSIVRLLVEMIEPYQGRVYDPCCGSGGMFVQSERFVEAHGGKASDISIYGQESNPTTWKLANMNLALRGIEAHLGEKHADTFHDNLHKDLKADFILANPPFNISDWGGERRREDVRWKYGTPPTGNANYGWIQHFIHHLAPNGIAGFVMANGSMSSNSGGEGEIRKALVEADLVDCMIALPGQLFFTTGIPVCLWFVTRNKTGGTVAGKKLRNRRRQTLFIDARKLGSLVTRTLRDLSIEEIARVADTYHAWRGECGTYEDVPGFCKSATIEEIAAHGFVLTPGRYVGAEDIEDGGEPFEEKLARLSATLREQFAESAELQARIEANLDLVAEAAAEAKR
ncbi:MAG: type I restriction-modification system subunit M [Phycisphaerales bacterium]